MLLIGINVKLCTKIVKHNKRYNFYGLLIFIVL